MHCNNCGSNIPKNSKFCPSCGGKIDNRVSYKKSRNKAKKKKGKAGFFIFFIFIIALLFVGGYILLSDSSNMDLGKESVIASENIDVSGGEIVISNNDSTISGFSIEILPGTYDENKSFKISETPIEDHKFGDLFEPVTPLISVDNGHEFSSRPMLVTIPIDISDNEFAMAFYYDRKKGKLEAIPFTDLNGNQITLITNHFSDIVVSKVSIEELEKISLSGNVSVDTGFEPGIDDWQFVNYGSALAPGGHCAGQSLTMAWYYNEKHLKGKEASLYGRFDNNGELETSDFWLDDSESYRFASTIQDAIDWESQEFHRFMDFNIENQKRVFYAFAYAMKMTGNPQFMGIYTFDEYGQIAGGHAIVAYKVENGKIYVADPNYPGQKDRYAQLGLNGFEPYSSGANASQIDAFGSVLYTQMHFIGSWALIDSDIIDKNYNKMLDGSVGDDVFPSTDFEIMTKYNEDINLTDWKIIDGSINLKNEYLASLPDGDKDYVIVKITPKAPGLVYSLFIDTKDEPEEEVVFEVFENSIYFEVPAKMGENTFSFYVEQLIGDAYSYVDFIDINITLSDEKEEEENDKSSNDNNNNNDGNKSEKGGTVKIIRAYDDNYNYNPDIVTDEYKVGDPFPYDFIESRTYDISGHKFGGYFTDPDFKTPLNYDKVPNEDVYIYIRWDKMTMNEILGKYANNNHEAYLEYEYYEFLPGGQIKHIYKYDDNEKIYVISGTWTYRESEYKGYDMQIFDVEMESSSFPLMFVVYEGHVRESSGKMYYKE